MPDHGTVPGESEDNLDFTSQPSLRRIKNPHPRLPAVWNFAQYSCTNEGPLKLHVSNPPKPHFEHRSIPLRVKPTRLAPSKLIEKNKSINCRRSETDSYRKQLSSRSNPVQLSSLPLFLPRRNPSTKNIKPISLDPM